MFYPKKQQAPNKWKVEPLKQKTNHTNISGKCNSLRSEADKIAKIYSNSL